MNATSTIILVVGLSLFGVLVVFIFRSSRQANKSERLLVTQLGFTPIEPDATMIAKLTALYQQDRPGHHLKLQRVAQRAIPEGNLLLFDMVDTDGEEDTWLANYAVAVISPRLNLPHFVLYPKAGQDTWLANLAGRVVEWAVARLGEPVPFPEYPEFQQRYAMIANEPDAVRHFFTKTRLEQLAQTRYYAIRASNDLFAFFENAPQLWAFNHSTLSQRIERALQLLDLFVERAP